MRILLFVHSLRRGGAERVLLEIASGLRAKNHGAEVVSWLEVDEYKEECYRDVPRHFLIRKDEYRWPWAVPSAAERFRLVAERYRPDVIEIHTPTVAWVAAWANLKIPCIHVLHGFGSITRRGSITDWWMQELDRLAQRRLNLNFVVPTPSMADAGATHYAISPSRFTCVPYGVDIHGFHPRRKTIDITPTIMMLGTLSPNKGQDWGIRAFRGVLKCFPDARLMIVGEGAHRPVLEKLVKEMGLDGKVRLAGFRKDAFDLMSASHVFWHLSDSEGLPMVVLEAMATGLPVVGFDVRGTRDAVVHEETGFLVPFGDARMVAQRTTDLLSDECSYQRLSLQARHLVEKRFSLECMVDGHVRVLCGAVEANTLHD